MTATGGGRERRRLPCPWRDLPLWYLWLAPFALLDLELNQLGGEVGPALIAFLVPFTTVTWLRWRIAGRGASWRGYAAASAALGAVILLGWSGPHLGATALLRAFEVTSLVGFALLAAHAARETRTFAMLFGTGLIYGLVLENGGVALGFFSEPGYVLHLPGLPAPLATGLGWCQVFYPLWWVVRRAAPGAAPGASALLTMGLALAFDLQLDPLATTAGFWSWHPTLPEAVRGVPWVNFCAWAAAVLPFSYAVFRAQRLPGSPALRLLRQLPLVLLAALGIVLALVGIAEAGVGWPSYALFRSAATGLLSR